MNDAMKDCLHEDVERLSLLARVSVALTAERNRERLLEMILLEAKRLCFADGGTLYLRTEDDQLRFAIMRNDSLSIALGGTTQKAISQPPLSILDPLTGEPNHNNVATHALLVKKAVNLPDVYDAVGFDFSGTRRFDEANDYRSKSFLTVPLVNNEDRVIAVLQLINARDENTGEVIPFPEADQRIVTALASLAAVALDNQMLIQSQRELMESFIKMIASAIDAKSPYTGAHCARVPTLSLMLAEAACVVEEGPLASFDLSDKEWYELKIAAWLHDCGKITTPVHIMDKATKLETIFDRIELVKTRFEVLRRDIRIRYLEARLAGDEEGSARESAELAQLDDDLAFLVSANTGSEFLSPEAQERIRSIGARTFIEDGTERPLLDENELSNLTVSRGTLTEDERLIINGHMVQTIQMLESLPFPRDLRRVPEYAGGHHEKMDGTGYPRGLFAADLSIPARMMAIADVFEALTAQDRPYKEGKTLSRAMKIMGAMKRHNHIDPDLFDLFVKSGVYRQYGEKYLPLELLDDVDEQALINIEPEPFETPPKELRDLRRLSFLPKYRPLRTSVTGEPTVLMRPLDL